MAGLLDFANSPAGIGLLSAIAGGMAGARRGTPINNIGRGLVTGVQGYAGAKDQLRQDEENAFAKRYKSLQMQELESKIANYKAQQEWKSGLPQVMDQAKDKVTPFEADNPFGEDLGNLANVQQGNPQAMQEYMMRPESPYADDLIKQQIMPDTVVVGKTLKNKNTGETLGYDETWKEEQATARAQRIEELNMRLEDQRLNREQQMELRRELAGQQAALRRDLAGQASADRLTIAQMVDASRQQKNIPKLPTTALKLQQEELDAIGMASTIQSDLGAIKAQVDGGELQLGPVKNMISAGKNMAGLSDENSRNYGTFKSTLEKLRNDSLRLNKGVQTEGDAVRAWNELLTNINDQKLVSKRIGEIQKINERAANLRKMQVDSIRSNFGLESMETGQYENQPAAVGNQPAGIRPPPKNASQRVAGRPTPKQGEVRNGYKYFGGDPANPKSWVKVKQ